VLDEKWIAHSLLYKTAFKGSYCNLIVLKMDKSLFCVTNFLNAIVMENALCFE